MIARGALPIVCVAALGACEFRPAGELLEADAAPASEAAPDAATEASIDASLVPAGYERLPGTESYYRVSAAPADFGAAAADCADDALRASLAVVDDDAENKALQHLVASRPEGRQIWLGIQDWHEEGVWRSLAFEPLGYTAWKDGEPNDGGPDGEDCAVLLVRFEPAHHEGRWNDLACTRERAYVCEWR